LDKNLTSKKRVFAKTLCSMTIGAHVLSHSIYSQLAESCCANATRVLLVSLYFRFSDFSCFLVGNIVNSA